MTLTFIHSPLISHLRLQNKTKANQLLGKVSPDSIATFCLPSLTFMGWKVLL